MNDETVAHVMQAIDPARDLSDEMLTQLFPLDRLMGKIHAGIEPVVPEHSYGRSSTRWRRVPARLGGGLAATAAGIAAIIWLLGSSPSTLQMLRPVEGVSTFHQGPATDGTTYRSAPNGGVTLTGAGARVPCRAQALDVTLLFPHSLHTLSRGFQGRFRFVNRGRACYLRETYVGVNAVIGGSHRIVSSSAAPAVALSGIIQLIHGGAATAWVSVESPAKPGLPACDPRKANGLVLLPLYPGWPSTYFALPSATPVCTSGHLVNIAGGPLGKGNGTQ